MNKKYYILVLFVLLLLPAVVNAKNSTIRLTESEEKIYYEDVDNDNYFIYHDDMVPGKKYTDVLDITNETSNKIALYLKAVVDSELERKKDNLLSSILMTIYLDDKEIYDGTAKGLDYSNVGVNIQDAVLLKEFKKGEKAVLKVITELKKEYAENNSQSVIVDWKFYGNFEESSEPIEVLDEKSKGSQIPLIITITGLAVLGVVGVVIYGKRTGKWLLIIGGKRSMKIEIPRINLDTRLYNNNKKKNKIENIKILKESELPSEKPGRVILVGKVDRNEDAILNGMENVEIDDYIYIFYAGDTYRYRVYKIEDGKDGILKSYKYEDKNTLIIATCKGNEKNLEKIYLAYLEEKE